MRLPLWINIVLFAAAASFSLAGCKARGSAEAPPADTETVQAIRQAMLAADPKAIVGIVNAVLPEEHFASVVDLPVNQFHIGEVITFIDTQQRPLTNGVIKNITNDALHVQYDPPDDGGRAPRVNDLAVRFKP